MKSQYVNGTINKDIYIHDNSTVEKRVEELEKDVVDINTNIESVDRSIEAIEQSIETLNETKVNTSAITTQISAESTDDQIPTAKAVWNKAAKYAKSKRFKGGTVDVPFGYDRFVLYEGITIADIYNAQMSGNQMVFIYDETTTITYQVCYCFIDELHNMCVLARGAHLDFDAVKPIENRYDDYLYIKTQDHGAAIMDLYSVKVPYNYIPYQD